VIVTCKQIIRDHGYSNIIKEVQRGGHTYTKVGFPLAGDLGDPPTTSSMSEMITVAAVHEFGAPKRNVPERSFIRTTFDENVEEINERKRIEYKKVLQGKQTVRVGIGRVGEFLTNKIKEKIRLGLQPELKVREGTPLWDTGQLLNTVQHVETENKYE
jgi:hypothetical protein